MKHRVLTTLTVTTTIAGITTLLATSVAAHPGHGLETDGVGLVHFVLQPSHGGVAVVLAFALVAASIVVKRRRHE
jgi:uncharacterized membrane protein YdcZ (DUF606 family)